MSKLMHEKNITLHKLIDETNSLTLDDLYKHLSGSSYFEDLKQNDKKEYIVGTIKKSYNYEAKRFIGKENVSGHPEFKFFKFLIKKQLSYYMIACHYEGTYGGYGVLKDFLISKLPKLRFEVIYKVFSDISYKDLKKVTLTCEKHEKSSRIFGMFTKKDIVFREIRFGKETSLNNDIVSKEELCKLFSVEVDFDEENCQLILFLKNGRKVNFLNIQNTFFELGSIPYKDDLPKEEEFIESVLKTMRNK